MIGAVDQIFMFFKQTTTEKALKETFDLFERIDNEWIKNIYVRRVQILAVIPIN